MKLYERIWLQPDEEYGEPTWCQNKINDDDIEYVNADLFAQLEAKLERLDVEMLTTDDDGNPVGCGMDLLDWQAHLQTELGIERLCIRELKAENEALREGWVLTLMDTGPQSLSHEDAKSYIDALLTKDE